VSEPQGAQSPRGKQPGRATPAAWAALILILAVVSGAVAVAVSLAVLRSQSRTNQQTVDLGSNVRINEESAVIQVAARAAPAVVTIVTNDSASGRRFGSGFLTTSDGYLVSNSHVVANAPALTAFVGTDATRHDVRVIDSDCQTGVAVLKVDGVRALPTLAFADPASLKVGQTVIAMGSPLAGNAVSRGIVSALHHPVTVLDPVDQSTERRFADTIQTDAVIDSRNSGGPLLNVAGQAVGVSVGATAQGRPFAYAISAAAIRAEVEQIIRDGQLVLADLGATLQEQSAQDATLRGSASGGLVISVVKGGPADVAGVRAGDVITALDEMKVDDAHPVGQLLMNQFRPAQRITVTISRQGASSEVSATLGRQHPRCTA
jgi:S1-C subfamily serine protease